MKSKWKMFLACTAIAMFSGSAAASDHIRFSVSIGLPAPYVYSPPVVLAPAPVYYGPSVYYGVPATAYYPRAVIDPRPLMVPAYRGFQHEHFRRREWDRR